MPFSLIFRWGYSEEQFMLSPRSPPQNCTSVAHPLVNNSLPTSFLSLSHCPTPLVPLRGINSQLNILHSLTSLFESLLLGRRTHSSYENVINLKNKKPSEPSEGNGGKEITTGWKWPDWTTVQREEQGKKIENNKHKRNKMCCGGKQKWKQRGWYIRFKKRKNKRLSKI